MAKNQNHDDRAGFARVDLDKEISASREVGKILKRHPCCDVYEGEDEDSYWFNEKTAHKFVRALLKKQRLGFTVSYF